MELGRHIYEALAEQTADHIIITDRDGCIQYVNAIFEEVTGYTLAEVQGENPRFLKSGQHPRAFYEQLWQTITAGLTFRGVMINKSKDGRLYYEDKTVTPVKDDEGNITHYVSTGKDVTAQLNSKQRLAESEAQHNLIIDHALDGVITLSPSGSIIGWNRQAARIFGWEAAEIMGRSLRQTIIPDPYYADLAAVLTRLQQREKPAVWDEHLLLGAVARDGVNLQVELAVTLTTNDSQPIFHLFCRDVAVESDARQVTRLAMERRSRQMQLSTGIAQEIAMATDLTDLYHRVVRQVKEQFGYYHTQLLRYDPDLDTIALTVGYGEVGEKMLAMNYSVPMGVGMIGQAAATGRALLRPHVAAEPNWQPNTLLPGTKGELAVPIKLRDNILGVLDVQSDRAGDLSEDDQLVLEGLCGQIAIAIESTTLRQEMESRLRELDALQRQMSRVGWDRYRLRQDRKRVPGYQYDHSGVRPLNVEAAANGQPQEEKTVGVSSLPAEKVETPLLVRGASIGSLKVFEDPERPLTAEERTFLNAVSEEIADALEAARLFEQTQDSLAEQERLTAELETVAQVSTAASTILDVDTLLQSVVDLAKGSFDLYHAHIYLIDEDGSKLVLKAGAGNIGRLMTLEGREIAIDAESIVARTARTRQGVLVNNVRQSLDFLSHPLLPDTQSELAVPMVVGEKLVGVLDLQSQELDHFTDEDLSTQRILAAQIAVAVENAQQYSEQVETAVKLRQVDQLKSEFLASMSHELRTPLNSIIGFADVLLEGLDGELNERMEEDVRLIRESGNHLRELIGEILDMSKIESGRMELRYEDVDVRQMTQDILATAGSLAQEKEIDLLLIMDEAVSLLRADRTRLRQILWNITGNAIKFTEEGSVTLKIEAKTDHLLFSVQDTGIGIKEENLAIVFEQFRQIDGGLNRAVGGSGLGMPITRSLVELHGGKIWVESEYTKGSIFFFTVPYAPPEQN